jgi:P27 family predicted phage terminase small subunit
MSGRKAHSAKTIDNSKHKKSNKEIEDRKEFEEAVSPTQKVRMPKGLSVIARRKFREIIRLFESAELNLITQLDTSMLMVYCESYAIYTSGQKIWAKAAKEDMDADQFIKLEKVLTIMDKQSKKMENLSEHLMLTPSGRARVGAMAAVKKPKVNGVLALVDRNEA